ncbi:FAD/NAD(P)-binding protein [Pantoea vagans]|uniref:FAD/NAD(P)-binding protein n=1 Tax=Pantoea vagans TaxID=470934 RepID=UPI003FA36C88
MYDVAIVGLGATGTSLLSQMQDEVYNLGTAKPQIAVFNPFASFARGNAFGDADAIHQVNTPPGMMSVTATEPDLFGHWLYTTFNARERWPSRLRYSDFIRQTYRHIKQAGVLLIDEYPHSVLSIRRQGTAFTVCDDGGNTLLARKVVMCLGALSESAFPSFAGQSGFISHYAQFDQSSTAPLLIAGSGLTAIDAFRYAYKKSQAPIHLYSRSGYVPTCLTESNRYTPVHLTWRNIMSATANREDMLNVFTRLLRKEFTLLRVKSEFRPAMKLLRQGQQTAYFRMLLTRAENSDLPWQDVLVSTRPYMHKLWNAFSSDQKLRFMKMYGAVWAAWRHPVPQEVFSELIEASAQGSVQFHQAKAAPEYSDSHYRLRTRSETLSFHHLWDATGGRLDITHSSQPLLRDLLNQSLIEEHPCGGIRIDPLTFQCQVKNRKVPGLFTIGPLSKGSLFSTNAFWFNARCAETWAKQWAVEFSSAAAKETL